MDRYRAYERLDGEGGPGQPRSDWSAGGTGEWDVVDLRAQESAASLLPEREAKALAQLLNERKPSHWRLYDPQEDGAALFCVIFDDSGYRMWSLSHSDAPAEVHENCVAYRVTRILITEQAADRAGGQAA